MLDGGVQVFGVDELRSAIALYLSPRETMSSVSRHFSRIRNFDKYWELHLKDLLRLVPSGSLHDGSWFASKRDSLYILTDWREDWYCYWDDSYGMPDDPETNFVFKPALEAAWCGLVRPQDCAMTTGPAARDVYSHVNRLLATVRHPDRNSIGWGDESDGEWTPLAMPWEGETLTPQTLLSKLGAHEVLQHNITDMKDESLCDEFLRKFLCKHTETAVFYAGGDLLNPVPCFAVALVRPDLVVGFVGGIIHT
jgi:hypothetical protein